ncbi:Uncharacterized protein Fot_35265 [Forsythia ovata]|uniref:Uncharacterized protein n=1 Tax=Forsythia ovata TaxID=205694 RepID=A0ABD1SL12_9LAMI
MSDLDGPHGSGDSEGPSSQPQEKHTMCQFMPTPGVNMKRLRERPATSSLPIVGEHDKGKAGVGDVRTEEIDISPMVEELQRFNADEAATTRADKSEACGDGFQLGLGTNKRWFSGRNDLESGAEVKRKEGGKEGGSAGQFFSVHGAVLR